MPSFLSKVFSRKKDENEGQLLEGKFEAVSPTVSPSADKFQVSLPVAKYDAPHLSLNLPSLKATSGPGDRPLSAVFESTSPSGVLLSAEQISQRQLNPLQSLLLVKACAAAITSHGLDTLGIMHPNWHSASRETQIRLISHFIRSIDPTLNSIPTTLQPTPESKVEAFENEIRTTRSAHDVASVLRWAVRHLKLEGNSFGTSKEWYNTFLNEERKAGYPPAAFSTSLTPLVPSAHQELLLTTLGLFQSLAAHAEWNGISGSKLSKLLGLWLLESEPRAHKEDTWNEFYTRWEGKGRMLEHLFLALIRDEDSKTPLPKRLTELTKHYPYDYGKTVPSDAAFLSRPRFSTRQHPALFVHVETEVPSLSNDKDKDGDNLKAPKLKLSSGSRKEKEKDTKKEKAPALPAYDPVHIINDAFSASFSSASDDTAHAIWSQLKAASQQGSSDSAGLTPSPPASSQPPSLAAIFSDETLRLISIIPSATSPSTTRTHPASSHANGTPKINVTTGDTNGAHRRSFSVSSSIDGASSALSKPSTSRTNTSETSATVTPTSGGKEDGIALSWAQFSTSGFLGNEDDPSRPHPSQLASTLMDKDVEVTTPGIGRKSSKKAVSSPKLGNSRRTSMEVKLPPIPASPARPAIELNEVVFKSIAKEVKTVHIDEAFIDFWEDSLADLGISFSPSKELVATGVNPWPRFVICKIKSGILEGEAPQYLVVSQLFVPPAPPPAPAAPEKEEKPAVAASTVAKKGEKEKPKKIDTKAAAKEKDDEKTSPSRPRPSSPRPSFSSATGGLSSTLGGFRKRFTMFGTSSGKDKGNKEKDPTEAPKEEKKEGPTVKVGEMGEIIVEQPEQEAPAPAPAPAPEPEAHARVASTVAVEEAVEKIVQEEEVKEAEEKRETSELLEKIAEDVSAAAKTETVEQAVESVGEPALIHEEKATEPEGLPVLAAAVESSQPEETAAPMSDVHPEATVEPSESPEAAPVNETLAEQTESVEPVATEVEEPQAEAEPVPIERHAVPDILPDSQEETTPTAQPPAEEPLETPEAHIPEVVVPASGEPPVTPEPVSQPEEAVPEPTATAEDTAPLAEPAVLESEPAPEPVLEEIEVPQPTIEAPIPTDLELIPQAEEIASAEAVPEPLQEAESEPVVEDTAPPTATEVEPSAPVPEETPETVPEEVVPPVPEQEVEVPPQEVPVSEPVVEESAEPEVVPPPAVEEVVETEPIVEETMAHSEELPASEPITQEAHEEEAAPEVVEEAAGAQESTEPEHSEAPVITENPDATRNPTPPPQPTSEHSATLEDKVVDLEPIPIVDEAPSEASVAPSAALVPPTEDIIQASEEAQGEPEETQPAVEESQTEELTTPGPSAVVEAGSTPSAQVALDSAETPDVASPEVAQEEANVNDEEVPEPPKLKEIRFASTEEVVPKLTESETVAPPPVAEEPSESDNKAGTNGVHPEIDAGKEEPASEAAAAS